MEALESIEGHMEAGMDMEGGYDQGDEGYQINVGEVKFLGIVREYNDQKGFGMIDCNEAQLMWNTMVYAYKDVLASANAGVGDTLRFGIHVNTRGQPQASLPVFKVAEDGTVLGAEGQEFVCVEEMAESDPNYVMELKLALEDGSARQNAKRARKGDDKGKGKGGKGGKGGKDKSHGGGAYGGAVAPTARMHMSNGGGAYGGAPRVEAGFHYGGGYDAKGHSRGAAAVWGGKGGSGKPDRYSPYAVQQQDPWGGGGQQPAVSNLPTLYISGVPVGATRREMLHIFRQYAGFHDFRQVERGNHLICFVTFETEEQAQFVLEALNGYEFDVDSPDPSANVLTVQFAKTLKRKP